MLTGGVHSAEDLVQTVFARAPQVGPAATVGSG